MSDESRTPQLNSFGDVVHWVIDEIGALCPSDERLEAFARDPNSPDFADVRYHVEEARCRLCNTELEAKR